MAYLDPFACMVAAIDSEWSMAFATPPEAPLPAAWSYGRRQKLVVLDPSAEKAVASRL